MDVESEQSDNLTSLNDDCIFRILNQISLDDLCAVSETCKKLKRLAEIQFVKKYPRLASQSFGIDVDCGTIGFSSPQNYFRCFSRQMQGVSINVPSSYMNAKLLQFVKENCSKDLKNAFFYDINWPDEFRNGIEEYLQNVETLQFYICDERKQFVDTFLRFFGIDRRQSRPFVKYPKLKHLKWHCDNLSLLKTFFKENPTIKRFTCRINQYNVDWHKQMLKIVSRAAIEELFVEVWVKTDFSLMQRELKMLNQNEHLNRFEIQINADHLVNPIELAAVRSFTGFHMDNRKVYFDLDQHIPAFKMFVNLTVLDMRYFESENVAVCFAQNLPNLVEFYYDRHPDQSKVAKIVTPFVRWSKKLVKIVIVGKGVENGEMSVFLLNEERKQLQGATNVIIYVLWSAVQNDPNNNMVIVKPITILRNYELDCPNPFIEYEFIEGI